MTGKFNTGRGKVKRYWPGKAPKWATFDDEDGGIRMTGAVALEKAFPTQEDSNIVMWDDDRRLIRLAKTRNNNREDIIVDHKRIRLIDDIVSTIREEENIKKELADLDEDALEERRSILREKLLKRQHEEEAVFISEEEEDEIEKEEEEDFEYETDSENEMMGLVSVKPVFVSRSENGTIAEHERLEARKRALEDITKRRMEERKLETKSIVAQEIWKDEQVQKNMELKEAILADVDTDEEVNKEKEHEARMARVTARIKRDKEERGVMLKQKDEIEKVRNMSEEERRQWEMENLKPALARKKRRRFMQKYHHKGAFFQSGADDRTSATGVRMDEMYKHDSSDPTGEDKMDKTILPKVMQVKHFGYRGRTKWTHLVNEDTTDLNNLWRYPLWAKYNSELAGINAPIAKPRGSKRLKVGSDCETYLQESSLSSSLSVGV